MEDEIFDIVTDLIREDISKDEAVSKLLSLFNDGGYRTQPKLVKCDNCEEMVEMISSGEFCPCCVS